MFTKELGKKLFAEFLGTTVFLTGISQSGTVLQVALCLLGAILMSIKISGANLNPLVSVGLFVVDKITKPTEPFFANSITLIGYIVVQIVGGAVAAGFARLLNNNDYGNAAKLNDDDDAGYKNNNDNAGYKFLGEMIGSLVFLSIVLASGSVSKMTGIPVPIQVIVGLYTGATIASHWTGGQLNPAVTVMQMINNREGPKAGFLNMFGQFIGLGLGIVLLLLFGVINRVKSEEGGALLT
jgi:glycerol uptake facilitator-like aquaporin